MNGTKAIEVRKRDGNMVPFDKHKLMDALMRSGATQAEAEIVYRKLSERLYDGITTRRIYELAYSMLRKKSHHVAGRYRLKKAMLELGPTGYPFESFVGKLFEADGYKAQTGILIDGKCVQHEVDVLAEKGDKRIMVECKFHSDSHRKSDVKVALYIHSRFLDLRDRWEQAATAENMQYKGMVVTNTRFTDDAMQFGSCAGLKMVSWDFPRGNSLKDWIDRSGYHPITSLASLRKKEKQFLLEKGVVLCRQLKDNFHLLEELGLSSIRLKKVKKETLSLLSL